MCDFEKFMRKEDRENQDPDIETDSEPYEIDTGGVKIEVMRMRIAGK